MNRKLFVWAGSLVIFSAGWCFDQRRATSHQPGGGAWKALSPPDHKFYLAGFVQGYGLGIIHAGSLAVEKYAPEKASQMTIAEKRDYEESLGLAHNVIPILLRSVSDSGLEATVNTFYNDYRNVPVCFEQAILLSAASLAGKPATEQELSTARRRGSESGCK